MSSSELESLKALLASHPKPENPTPEKLRKRFEKILGDLPAPGVHQFERVNANGVSGAFISVEGVDVSRCVYYFHGGGYVIGSVESHRGLACRISEASNAKVLSIDYSLAPESPFPAAIKDAIRGYEWLLESGVDAGRIVIAGDSAGGGLAMATLVALRDRNLPMPAAAVCFSPWVDMEATGASMETRANIDPMVQKEGLLTYVDLYLNGADKRDPLASPLYAELHDLPPILIQVGDAETLLDDSTRLTNRLRECSVEVDLDIWDHMIHVWQLYAPVLSEGREAIQQAGAFIAAKFK